MRDNGLDAVSYAAIGDLDPRITDRVLGLLRDAGVAAYVEAGRAGKAGEGERDRLHVDANAVDAALTLLDERVPELRDGLSERPVSSHESAGPTEPTDAAGDPAGVPNETPAEETPEDEPAEVSAASLKPRDEPEPLGAKERDEAVWAEIVAAYHRELDTSVVGPWPAQEDLDPDDPKYDAADRSKPPPSAPATPAAGSTTAVASASELEPGDDEHFVPPDPPLPQFDTVTKAAWAGLLGGPALLLLVVITGWAVPSWLRIGAIIACGAGFLTLVLRSNDPEDDSHGGAVV